MWWEVNLTRKPSFEPGLETGNTAYYNKTKEKQNLGCLPSKIKESTAKALWRGELKHALGLPKVVKEIHDSVARHAQVWLPPEAIASSIGYNIW